MQVCLTPIFEIFPLIKYRLYCYISNVMYFYFDSNSGIIETKAKTTNTLNKVKRIKDVSKQLIVGKYHQNLSIS